MTVGYEFRNTLILSKRPFFCKSLFVIHRTNPTCRLVPQKIRHNNVTH